jgi:hypothetical protein
MDCNHQHSLFWILEALVKIINSNYLDYSTEEKHIFREGLKYLYINSWNKYGKLVFIMNKLAYLIVMFMKFDYPENNKLMIKEYIDLSINDPKNDEEKIIKLDFLLVIFLTFDDELVKFRHTFSQFEDSRSTIIKDNMRTDPALPELIQILSSIISNKNNLPKKLISNALKLSASLIDWNSLNLFENVILASQKLLVENDYMKFSLEIYLAVINKGMELKEKIEILKLLDILTLIDSFLNNTKIVLQNDCLFILGDMVLNLGIYFAEGARMMENGSISEESKFSLIS